MTYLPAPCPPWIVADCGIADTDELIGQFLCCQFLKSQWIAPISGPVTLDLIIAGLLQRPLTQVEASFFASIGFGARSAIVASEAKFFCELRSWAERRREEAARFSERLQQECHAHDLDGNPLAPEPAADPFALGGAP